MKEFSSSVKKMLCAVLIMIGCSTQSIYAQGIVFMHDLDQALAKAKAENKLVFVDFYTSWCGPCKVLDKEVFSQEKTGSYFNSKFVNCKVQCDDKGVGVELGEKYKIIAYPTLIFLNANGEIVHSEVGGTSVDGLLEIAEVAVNPEKNLRSVMKKWESGDRNPAFVVSYFKRLKEVYRNDQASSDFLAYFNKLSVKDKTSKSTFDLIKIVGAAPFSPLLDYVEVNTSKFYKSVGKKEVDGFISRIYLSYLHSLAVNGTREDYDAALEKFKAKKYPYTEEYEMYCSVYLAYKPTNDIKAYMERGTQFLAKYGKNNDTYTLGLASLLGNYTARPNQGSAGIQWMEDLLKRNPDPKYMDVYFYIVWRNAQYDKALEIGKKMREIAIKNNRSTKSIDSQIEMINGIKAKEQIKAAQKNKQS